MEIAHEIVDEELSMKALGQIAQVMTVQENEDLPRQALAAIPDDAHRMFALIALSDTVAAQREKAIAFLDEANRAGRRGAAVRLALVGIC